MTKSESISQELKNHTNRRSPLVCKTCTESGFSGYDGTGYPCTVCKKTLGHKRFNKQLLKNSKRRANIMLKCLDCESKLPCEACKIPFEKNAWTVTERKNWQQHGTKLVCKSCRDKGCDPADTKLYESCRSF